MSKDPAGALLRLDKINRTGAITRAEILQQPLLWETTLERVRQFDRREFEELPVVITGAGTSAHAAAAIASAWPGARAIATTSLLTDHEGYFDASGILLSIARSGDSPESVAVVRRIQKLYPSVRHFAITCNAEGKLANYPGVKVLKLDPRTNDSSLVMTSSFSNLVLAGLSLKHLPELTAAFTTIAANAKLALPELEQKAKEIAASKCSRAVILASGPLIGAAREASLKILEMTAGQIAVLSDTYLGLRHGPMAFLRKETLVLCFISSASEVRRYEQDLLEELHAKKLGKVIAISPSQVDFALIEHQIPAIAPNLPDRLRTPFEIIFPQLLGLYLSLAIGLDPDSPSPDGVINRVVQGVRLYED